jgi:hypothetical protein
VGIIVKVKRVKSNREKLKNDKLKNSRTQELKKWNFAENTPSRLSPYSPLAGGEFFWLAISKSRV